VLARWPRVVGNTGTLWPTLAGAFGPVGARNLYINVLAQRFLVSAVCTRAAAVATMTTTEGGWGNTQRSGGQACTPQSFNLAHFTGVDGEVNFADTKSTRALAL